MTIQMWSMNSSTQTSPFHISHFVSLYGFHICIFLFMSTLSSIIAMKCSPGLNPAIKLTGVTLIVRHRHSSDHKCCTTYCCFKSQTNLPPTPCSLVPSTVIWSQFVIKRPAEKALPVPPIGFPSVFCIFFHLFSCCSD